MVTSNKERLVNLLKKQIELVTDIIKEGKVIDRKKYCEKISEFDKLAGSYLFTSYKDDELIDEEAKQIASEQHHDIGDDLTRIWEVLYGDGSYQGGDLADLTLVAGHIKHISKDSINRLTARLDKKEFNISEIAYRSQLYVYNYRKFGEAKFKDTPERKDNYTIFANEDGFYRIFYNIFLNDLEAACHKGIKEVEVDYSFSERNGFDQISIRDNCGGIPFKMKLGQRLFKLGATTKEGSKGRGLYICKRIVEAHGGKIIAKNYGPLWKPKGAIFQIELPQIIYS